MATIRLSLEAVLWCKGGGWLTRLVHRPSTRLHGMCAEGKALYLWTLFGWEHVWCSVVVNKLHLMQESLEVECWPCWPRCFNGALELKEGRRIQVSSAAMTNMPLWATTFHRGKDDERLAVCAALCSTPASATWKAISCWWNLDRCLFTCALFWSSNVHDRVLSLRLNEVASLARRQFILELDLSHRAIHSNKGNLSEAHLPPTIDWRISFRWLSNVRFDWVIIKPLYSGIHLNSITIHHWQADTFYVLRSTDKKLNCFSLKVSCRLSDQITANFVRCATTLN